MWLLQLQKSGVFSLVEHVGKNIPRYAILSHTWGPDNEEVTFRDLREGTYKSRVGYRKLTFCAKQAARDGLQFFWIDTCCIDKSSSAELTEAINSMFQWYRRANICYVYLSDVSTDDSIGNNLSSQQTWKTAFRRSRWFTRGWTLQELLAPKSVKFFTADGIQLGDKVSLVQEIHDITGIPIRALQGEPLSQFSVDERMSWAESRETKREEDAAYSLLGIFGVHMPLIYGEERESAFNRLYKKIQGSSRNESHGLVSPKLSAKQSERNSEPFSNLPFTKSLEDIEGSNISGVLSTWKDALEQIEAFDEYRIRFKNDKLRLQEWTNVVTVPSEKRKEAYNSRLQDADYRIGLRLRNDIEPPESFADISGSLSGKTKNKKYMAPPLSARERLGQASRRRGKITNQAEIFPNVMDSLYTRVPQTNPESHSVRRLAELEAGKVPSQYEGCRLRILLDERFQDLGGSTSVQEALQLLVVDIQHLRRRQSHFAILDWLGITEFDDRYDANQHYDKQLSLRLEGTCEWIFSHPAYSAWISEDFIDEAAKILWICAPGGCGKTILCARLVESLQDKRSFPVAFFFASPHAQSGGEPNFIIRSWIAQIAHLDSDILKLVKGHSEVSQRASDSVIWSIFGFIVSQNRNYVFVLDGLDEYSRLNEYGRLDDVRAEFLKNLKEAIKGTVSRVLVSSRGETDIAAELSPAMPRGVGHVLFQCRISKEDVQDDIALFSKSVVDNRLPKKDDHLRQNLAGQLAEKCEGMFLWIKLQQDQLRGGKNAKQLQNIVNDMPIGLPRTYERNWKTIQNRSPDEQRHALAILRWTAFAFRPLTVAEITEAVIVKPHKDGVSLRFDNLPDDINDEYINGEIIDICGTLVEVRAGKPTDEAGSRTLHLIHPSVREFLLSTLSQNPVESSKYPPLFGETHSLAEHHKYIATICLAYLNCNDNWQRSKDQKDSEHKYIFIDYAARHWNSHVIAAGEGDSELLGLMKTFFRPESGGFGQWRRYIETPELVVDDVQEQKRAVTTPLYYAALFDLISIMEYIWAEDETQLDLVGGEYGTPLQATCFRGHELAFDRLIHWGADPNVEGGIFGVPINAAIAGGHKTMVKKLVNMRVNLAVQDSMGRTPLYTAAKNGHSDIVALLIEKGAERNTRNKYNWTPLYTASSNGHLEVVKILLENGADIRAANNGGVTPLNVASNKGYLEVVKILLDNKADVGVANNDGWTPLNAASNNGHLEVVKVLLENGADVGVANNDGFTPLNAASSNCHLEVVKVLLENGADVGVANNDGWTPLNAASNNGHLKVVKVLLENGADVGVASKEGWTPLNAASRNGHLEVVKVLLDNKADVGVANNDGWTPLNAASNNGHLKVVKVLLENGADVGVANNDGFTPLNAASSNCHLEVVKVLLENGADVGVANNDGWTPLNAASNNGHLEVVKVLLENRADVGVANEEGWTPLFTASKNSHVRVVKVLLENGADVGVANEERWKPLYSASYNGHLEVVRVLLENGADVGVANNNGFTPLNAASVNGHLEVVKVLLENGADVGVASKEGWTPLNAASNNGHVEVVKVLLENRADVGVANEEGWTPLFSASYNGHLEVVRALLENGADVGVANEEGWTPLFSASYNGHLEVVRALLENGADVGVANNDGWVPLNAASKSGHLEVIKVLLENEADVEVPNNYGWTPLNLASDSGYLEVVKFLVEKGANITVANSNGWTPINSASDSGHLEVVKFLIEKGADITVANNYGWTPLNLASKNGHLEVVKFLVEKGGDITVANSDGWTPIYSASNSGHLEVVKVLLENGADIGVANNDGWTPLNGASSNGHLQVAKVLLENEVDVGVASKEGWTPVNAASNNGHLEVVKVLLGKGADVGVANNDGSTPLNAASSNGHLEVVKVLLENGADVGVPDNYGWTPLNLASDSGHLEVVKFLVEKGANITVANSDGWTPLYSASNGGHVEVVKVLLENGADVGVTNNDGWTPLNSASDSGHVEVVKTLLENGADVGVTNNDGWTPLNSASSNGHLEVVKLLLDRGADVNAQGGQYGNAFHAAAYRGHLRVLELLISKGSVTPLYDRFERTLLWWAAAGGSTATVEALVAKYNFDPRTPNKFGQTPSWIASKKGYIAISEFLAKEGGETNIQQQVPSENDDNRTSISCDVCTLDIKGNEFHFHCRCCAGGDWDMCADCEGRGAFCEDATHLLVKRTMNEGDWVEVTG